MVCPMNMHRTDTQKASRRRPRKDLRKDPLQIALGIFFILVGAAINPFTIPSLVQGLIGVELKASLPVLFLLFALPALVFILLGCGLIAYRSLSKLLQRTVLLLTALFFIAVLIMLVIELVNYFLVIGTSAYLVWPPSLSKTFYPDPSIFPGVNGPSHFTTSSLGYRGPPLGNASQEYRILTIGGSTTECLYLDDSKTWADALMHSLNISRDGRRVVVMNVGRSGYSTDENALQAKYLIPQFKPDMVIMLSGANDLIMRLLEGDSWTPYTDDFSKAFYATPAYSIKSTFTYHVLFSLYVSFILKEKPQDSTGEIFTEKRAVRKTLTEMNETPPLDASLKNYVMNVERIMNETRPRNITLVLITQPTSIHPNLSPGEDSLLWFSCVSQQACYSPDAFSRMLNRYNSALLAACEGKQDTVCVDAAADMTGNSFYFYDDLHFNEQGARRLSNILSAAIRERVP